MEIRRRFYVTSVSSTAVLLSPEPVTPNSQPGTNINQVTFTTSEATANADFWGATGQCGRYEVIVRRVS